MDLFDSQFWILKRAVRFCEQSERTELAKKKNHCAYRYGTHEPLRVRCDLELSLYVNSPGATGAPPFLALPTPPAATPVATATATPTKNGAKQGSCPGSCPNQCALSGCQASCCSAQSFMPAQFQPMMMQVPAQVPPPQCSQACLNAPPGGCTASPQCPPRCCRRRK